ncbi:hypothetical protein LAZ40_22570 [Cereibacter sphaeroides]|uniref:hypothetical protein n=1 Tax=Rhodobacterales TaxID=204455 RepID=UPI000BBEEB0A|nr:MULTISPECIES: hypothetical protein [Paracoccaceae]MCE6953077.1 hypothetical protein [Cereibacter sphaeroides]MCE6961824.1 hypothetical protein [Cereibacter sphaeroides]MCE6970599.1 hypothetical protein [Cereibacter sphaeroides]MCE6975805.1 hypothetical protein [Cereibacter sphaeroides]
MSGSEDLPIGRPVPSRLVAERVLARAPQDLVFVMRFLGESQDILQAHFRLFLTRRLAEAGATADEHPLLPFFIDSHASELRDFVFTGVSLARQFRLREIEELTGDAEATMRIDVWDAIASHIELAEARFADGIGAVVERLRRQEADLHAARRPE